MTNTAITINFPTTKTPAAWVEPNYSNAQNFRQEWRVIGQDNIVRIIPRGCFRGWMHKMGMERYDAVACNASAFPNSAIPILLSNGEFSGFTLLPKYMAWTAAPGVTLAEPMYVVNRTRMTNKLKNRAHQLTATKSKKHSKATRSGVIR